MISFEQPTAILSRTAEVRRCGQRETSSKLRLRPDLDDGVSTSAGCCCDGRRGKAPLLARTSGDCTHPLRVSCSCRVLYSSPKRTFSSFGPGLSTGSYSGKRWGRMHSPRRTTTTLLRAGPTLARLFPCALLKLSSKSKLLPSTRPLPPTAMVRSPPRVMRNNPPKKYASRAPRRRLWQGPKRRRSGRRGKRRRLQPRLLAETLLLVGMELIVLEVRRRVRTR